jgi:hypothetical protein
MRPLSKWVWGGAVAICAILPASAQALDTHAIAPAGRAASHATHIDSGHARRSDHQPASNHEPIFASRTAK